MPIFLYCRKSGIAEATVCWCNAPFEQWYCIITEVGCPPSRNLTDNSTRLARASLSPAVRWEIASPYPSLPRCCCGLVDVRGRRLKPSCKVVLTVAGLLAPDHQREHRHRHPGTAAPLRRHGHASPAARLRSPERDCSCLRQAEARRRDDRNRQRRPAGTDAVASRSFASISAA